MKTVTDHQNDIQNAQMEIAKIQASCLHNAGYECVMYSYGPGRFHATRLCTVCRMPLMGITAEEEKKAIEWSKGMTVTAIPVSK